MSGSNDWSRFNQDYDTLDYTEQDLMDFKKEFSQGGRVSGQPVEAVLREGEFVVKIEQVLNEDGEVQ